ncbi:MAG TPA: PilZ domain-containing protein [Geobacteraceae bacterium]
MREREKRIPAKLGCWIEGEGGGTCVTISDLSETGIAVITPDPLPEGRIVLLKIYTPFAAEPVPLKAEVIWSRMEPDSAMGLKFLGVDEKTKGILKGAVRLLHMHGKGAK